MLQTDNIQLKINGNLILEDLSLDIIPGEVLSVIGPNGAGKSTFLKVLSNELAPNKGHVLLNNKKMPRHTPKEQARLRAILPQSSHLAFPFRMEEVVMMGRSPYRHSHSQQQNLKAMNECIDMAQVSHLKGRMFNTLSGGEKQRVQLARVLTQLWDTDDTETPRYLLLDEPTSALDLSHQHHVLGLAHHLAKSWNIGVLAVLHDINLAALYADQVAILVAGKLHAYGTPDDVLSPCHIHSAFDVKVDVIDHPYQKQCPLVIASKPEFNLQTYRG